MTADDLIRAIKSKPGITVREVVAALKPLLAAKDSNKDKMKLLMKQCCTHDKKTGIVTLKDAYL